MANDVGSQLQRGLKLLSANNPKVLKGGKRGYATAILHLAPAWESGHNTCAKHTKDCAKNCIFFSGRGAMKKIQEARIRKTKLFFEDHTTFLTTLRADVNKFFYNALAFGYDAAYRFNGTSDIRWERYGIMQDHPDCTFYDYTKIANRRGIPPNYHLTFSFSGDNLEACREALSNGMNVAVPFLKAPPPMWLGHPTVDGDDDDLRFLNGGPYIIALKAKGRLRNDPASPFLGDNHHV